MKHSMPALFSLIICTLFSIVLPAADDCDININGDFRNASLETIPGWKTTGKYSIVPRKDGKYALKLSAETGLTSNQFPVRGKIVELEADLRGSGSGTFSVICFDKDKKFVKQCSSRKFTVSNRKREFKQRFVLPENAAFAAIGLQISSGAEIIVSDIDAEFKQLAATTSATSRYTPPVKEQIRQNLPAAPANPLINARCYKLDEISARPYQLTLSRGDDFEFDLIENTGSGNIWTLARCDGSICRVKVEHERDGIWPFRYEKANVEIEALRAGETTIYLTHPGKQMIIHLKVQ